VRLVMGKVSQWAVFAAGHSVGLGYELAFPIAVDDMSLGGCRG
jgi:hypothetical protein